MGMNGKLLFPTELEGEMGVLIAEEGNKLINAFSVHSEKLNRAQVH